MKKKILLVIPLFISIGLLYYYIKQKNTYEKITNMNIYFLTKEETIKLLILNNDKYYNTFNEIDYKVRNIKKIEEYNEYIKESTTELNNEQINLLKKIIHKINNKLNNFEIIGFDGIKAKNIKWKIGFIKGDKYEFGLPHTRIDTILLPIDYLKGDTKELEKTLIHEKIHIYQKKYQNDIDLYLKNEGFNKLFHKNIFNDIRANSDIDNYVYLDKNNNIMRSIYKNNPNNLNDIIFTTNYKFNYYANEHPYEYMAYKLENLIFNNY